MAYINGNKPIVTDGLIYALDFGNSRCYTSGSTQATSLAYDRATTSISGSPAFNNDLLDFTSTKFIKRDGSLPALDPNGTFTVMFVGNSISSSGTFLRQDTLNSTINPTSSLFGFGLDSGDFSRSYPGFTSSSLQHVTYRYSEGTIDTFINGIPVTASVANASLTNTAVSNALFIGSGSAGFSGSLAQFYVYNRALSADEIYTTYLVSAERNGLPADPKPYTLDENVYKYVQTTGITDNDTISAIDTFVSSLKSNGLWNKMTAIYPFLTTSTGSQAVNLKDPGVLGLGLTGSFTGSNVGLTPASSTAYVDTLPSNIPYPSINSSSAHLSLVSYDVPQGNGFLAGNSLPALGGDVIIASGSKVYHAFKTVGTSSFIPLVSSISNVEVMVIAGGGGGSNSDGGGGGAGGLIYSSSFSITPGAGIQVIVGNGGTGGNPGTAGENSVFGTIISTGGGRGGGNSGVAGTGGSGGGAGGYLQNSGSGIPGQGNDGGDNIAAAGYVGAGGGGAGSKGQNAVTNLQGGAGGSGSYYSQFTTLGGSPSGWFAGGGGGCGNAGRTSLGGIGGGGGGTSITNASNGTLNTGGGGGGAKPGYTAGSGGSGIVIVGYDISNITAITGSGTGFYLTDSAITASVNSQFTSGITGSGNIGFLTVSRTGSNSFSIRKNNSTITVNSASLGALSTDIFFNTANLAGSGSLPQPTSISYASIGAGLTDSEVSTYYNLVSQFQTNLKRQNTLLDNYSGAAAAYSLRRIGPSGYFGPAIRVRRDSDNTLRDIGFTSDGQLDTVGLLDFVGVTGSGFVQTWYDQSGNGYDATQATTTKQPLVINSGTVLVENTKPAAIFDGVDDELKSNFGSGSVVEKALFIVGRQNEGTDTYAPMVDSFEAQGDPNIGVGRANNSLFAMGALVSGSEGNSNAWNNFKEHQLLWYANSTNSGSISFLINGSSVATGTKVQGYNGLTIGANRTRSFRYYSAGPIQEVLFYIADKTNDRIPISDNINTNYKIYGDATASFDPDYQAFITATGITEPTQSAALETLVSDLKSYGLWNKMKAIYPMVTDKNNRFAQSEAFNLTWNAVSASVSPDQTAAPNGTTTADLILDITSSVPVQTFTVVNNGVSAYTIDGSDNPTLTLQRGKTYDFDINASGHPFYIMTGSGAYSVDGQYNTGVTGQGTQIGILTFVVPENAPGTLAYVCQNHSSMNGTINVIENTDEHYLYQTIPNLVSGNEYVLSVYGKFYNRPWIALQSNEGAQAWFDLQNGVTGSYTGSNVSITNEGSGWYRCALYFTGSSTGVRNQHIHLSDADGSYNYTGVAGSGSYLWGAQFENGNLLGPYRKTEGSGFTTGSILDQMKFNLVNPVDTDAGFRLTYSGSWNAGYGGNTGDGSTAWADTKLNISSSLIAGNSHLSIYQTTIGTKNSEQAIGSYDTFYMSFYRSPSNTQLYAVGQPEVSNSLTTALGFYQINGLNTTQKSYRNGITLRSDSITSTTLSNSRVFIGAAAFANFGNIPIWFDNKQTSLVTIGDGLTDYEAKALYWIVQKYQTTLGRQVY